jgi:mannose-6-phosphate isomerase-like protein (cupin superfamily)
MVDEIAGAIVVRPGSGLRVGNVEFLALSEHTPRFNFSLITMRPGHTGPEPHVHDNEDDAFYVLDDEMTFLVDETTVAAGAGTFVLVPPGVEHTFANAPSARCACSTCTHAPASTCACEADRRRKAAGTPGGGTAPACQRARGRGGHARRHAIGALASSGMWTTSNAQRRRRRDLPLRKGATRRIASRSRVPSVPPRASRCRS